MTNNPVLPLIVTEFAKGVAKRIVRFGGGKRTIKCPLQTQFWRPQKVGFVWSVPLFLVRRMTLCEQRGWGGALWYVLNRRSRGTNDVNGTHGLLWNSAVFCENLQFPAICASEMLQFLGKAKSEKTSVKAAKTANLAPFVPFSLGRYERGLFTERISRISTISWFL